MTYKSYHKQFPENGCVHLMECKLSVLELSLQKLFSLSEINILGKTDCLLIIKIRI